MYVMATHPSSRCQVRPMKLDGPPTQDGERASDQELHVWHMENNKRTAVCDWTIQHTVVNIATQFCPLTTSSRCDTARFNFTIVKCLLDIM
jgi:hypothetical protein